jgi:hypothetical protein
MILSAVPTFAAPVATTEKTVAVFDYAVVRAKGISQDSGKQVADMVSALLSQSDTIKIVERQKIEDLFREQGLSQAGFTEGKSAVRVQQLVGVEFFVSGKLFVVGKNMFLTSSVVATETGLKKTIMVKAPLPIDYDELAAEASVKIMELLAMHGDALAHAEKEVDTLALLKEKIEGSTFPSCAVHITERHMPRAIIDPAAQTEVLYMLQALGVRADEYADSIDTESIEDGLAEVRKSLKGVDVLFLGEAFSEFVSRRGDLVSCKARLELKAIDVKTHKLLAITRSDVASVDAGEALAAKKALAACAQKALLDILPKLAAK